MERDLSINEITQLQVDPQFVGFNAVLLILAMAGFIFGFFYLIRNYLFPLIESEKMILQTKRLIFRIEVLAWASFALIALTYLLVQNPIIVVVIIAVITLVALSFWRDFFPGLFFRLAQTYALNDTVAMNDVKGQIEKIGYTAIQLRTETDELVFIPYRKIADQLMAKQQAKGKLIAAKITLPMVEMDRKLMHEKMEVWLRNCPWAVPQRNLVMTIVEPGKTLVTVYAIDQISIAKIEYYLMQKVSQ